MSGVHFPDNTTTYMVVPTEEPPYFEMTQVTSVNKDNKLVDTKGQKHDPVVYQLVHGKRASELRADLAKAQSDMKREEERRRCSWEVKIKEIFAKHRLDQMYDSLSSSKNLQMSAQDS